MSLLVASTTVTAQSPGQVQLDVLARDHYTRTALDSVALAIYFDGALLDSTVTGPDGRALMNFAVSLLEGPGELPSDFSLSFNYPNPFHSETRVDLGVPESQSVRMEIYNILGQRVATQALQLDAGNYALNLTLGHLPVGVYFLRVAGRDAKVEKMIKMGRTFSSPGPVFRMSPMGMGSPGRPVIDQKAGSGYLLSSDGGYQLRAWRDRYQHFETSPEIEGNPAELLVEMRRNNIVTIATVDPDEGPVSREVRISGEQFTRTIATPDTLILASGIYTVVSTTDSLFAVNDVFEIVSRDSAYVIRPFVPQDAEVSGQVANDQLEFVAGAQVKVYRDGSEYASTTTHSDGRFSTTLLADGGLYSLVIYPPAGNGVFDPETHSGFSPDARVITPRPGGSYELNFLLYTEPVLALPGGGTELPPGNYTLATDGGTVMVSNIPPDLGIVGGTARAYSPTITADAFPGEFATRQEGFESALFSGGFASVNLLRSDGNGGVEPISELRDSTGTPVRVELRFRMDPLDYNVLRDPETLSHLPGYVNRPDTIDVPLYFYDEQLGDWILSPEFGWLESGNGAIPFDQFDAIREGSYEGTVYVTGLVDHFTFYNLDYPARDACVTGRILDQNFQPVSGAELVIRSMPEAQFVSYFSNEIKPISNPDGYFQARVPRTETGPPDDWNENNKVDFFRFNLSYEDPNACAISYFDDGGSGYLTPFYPEENGCKNIGSLYVSLREAKKKDFKITFLDIERDGQPDYPLFTDPPSTSGFNYATATLLDNRISLMGKVWKCICNDGTPFQICNYQSTTDPAGRAEFTLPVLIPDPDLPLTITESLTGTISYRKDRPDLGSGAHEVANCSYLVPENQGSKTVRCEVTRRGPPIIDIIRIATDDGFDEENPFQTGFLYDDMVTAEVEGIDLNDNPVNIFYWTNPLETSLLASGNRVTIQAWRLFGTGENLGIMAHGIDYYGWRNTDLASGFSVEEVDVEVTAARDLIVPGDTTLVTAVVTGANNQNVLWSVDIPQLASINSSGILTGIAPGQVTITGRSMIDPGKTDQVIVEIANLVAVFKVDPLAGDSTTVFTFDASDSKGDIAAYDWDLGDGTTASGETVVHTFASSDKFQVSLTVTGTSGLTAQTTKTVSATGEPVAVIRAEPVSGNPPLQVSFDGSDSFTVTGSITSWNWEFGDGNSGEGATVEHSYQEAGMYYATLKVEDDQGRSGRDSVQISVITGPVAQFSVTPQSGEPPYQVTVDASATEGEIIRYSWDFGDGTTIPYGFSVQNHTYLNAGLFEITLEVEDNSGSTDVATAPVTVSCNNLKSGSINISSIHDLQQLTGVCGIDGHLTINTEDLTDLGGLSGLSRITGILAIQNNANLVSLDGIENLLEAGRVRIQNNPKLSEIDGFQHTVVKQEVNISQNPALKRISGFNRIKELETELFIMSNDSLESINGFRNLEVVYRLNVRGNRLLESIDGFDIIREITDSFSVRQMESLTEITGFPELRTAGRIYFDNNPLLADLSFLNNVTVVQGDIEIRDHPSLLSADIFNNLEVAGRNLRLSNSPLLTNWPGFRSLRRIESDFSVSGTGISHCELADFTQSIREKDGVGGYVNIWGGNANELQQNVSITNETQLSQLEGVCFINGDVIINGSNLQNLSGLDSLRTIGDRLIIYGNGSLTSLTGLHNLLNVASVISIQSNAALADLSALSRITELRGVNLAAIPITNLSGLSGLRSLGSLTMSGMPEITDLSGLENLVELRTLDLSNLDNLVSINGIQHLEEIQSTVSLSNLPKLNDEVRFSDLRKIGRLSLSRLDELTDLSLFEALEEVAFSSSNLSPIVLSQMNGLQSLNGLENLHTLSGLSIQTAPEFQSLTGLNSVSKIYSFNIFGAGKLENLTGLENLKTLETLSLRSNPMLTDLTGLSGLVSLNNISLNDNQSLLNLEGLSADIESEVMLEFSYNPSLTNLTGLEWVTSARSIALQNNSSLESLSGLENLKTITEGGLIIQNHPQLKNLEVLSGLESLSGNFNWASISLANLPLIGSLEPLSGISAESVFRLSINFLHSLKNLAGLEAMTDLDFADVSFNDSLETLQGLNNLRNVGILKINSNPKLEHLDDLSGVFYISNFFNVVENASLKSVSGMTTLNRVENTFAIAGNIVLPTCDAEALASQVQNREGYGFLDIRNNNDAGTCPP